MPNIPKKGKSYKWLWIVLVVLALYPVWKMIFIWLGYFFYGFTHNV